MYFCTHLNPIIKYECDKCVPPGQPCGPLSQVWSVNLWIKCIYKSITHTYPPSLKSDSLGKVECVAKLNRGLWRICAKICAKLAQPRKFSLSISFISLMQDYRLCLSGSAPVLLEHNPSVLYLTFILVCNHCATSTSQGIGTAEGLKWAWL